MYERIVDILIYLLLEIRKSQSLQEIDLSQLEKDGYTTTEISAALSLLFEKMNFSDTNEKNVAMAGKLGADEGIVLKDGINVAEQILQLTNGVGVDVAMEMAGPNASVVNAMESARRGGQVILFGLKDGEFVFPKFSKYIVKGLTLHGVIGRRIFETWETAQEVLADTSNGVQEKIWKVMLQEGKGTVLPFGEYNQEAFKKAMDENPKIIFKM